MYPGGIWVQPDEFESDNAMPLAVSGPSVIVPGWPRISTIKYGAKKEVVFRYPGPLQFELA
jgi:hypothetical protein